MLTKSRFYAASLALLVCTFLFSASDASAQTKIGVAAAVKNQVFGSGQPLSAGSSVHAQEVIKTGDVSSAQLQFVDQTNLNIGPKSEVTLDSFVYDPNRGNGNVVINTGKGAFRFVSGSQDHKAYKINTPVATIGVRGTVFYLINGPAFTVIVQQNGTTVINVKGGGTFELAAGYSALIMADGSFEVFKNADSTIVIRQAGLDLTLLQEYSTYIGQTANSFGGLPDMPKITCYPGGYGGYNNYTNGNGGWHRHHHHRGGSD